MSNYKKFLNGVIRDSKELGPVPIFYENDYVKITYTDGSMYQGTITIISNTYIVLNGFSLCFLDHILNIQKIKRPHKPNRME